MNQADLSQNIGKGTVINPETKNSYLKLSNLNIKISHNAVKSQLLSVRSKEQTIFLSSDKRV